MTTINLVGIGGNGSKMLIGLKNIHQSLLHLGNSPLMVRAFDPDTISESNLVRQVFYPGDLGKNKAQVLTERLNLYYGLSWKAYPKALTSKLPACDILITCTDSKKARLLAHKIAKKQNCYHLDLGNSRYTGQVVLGHPGKDIPTVVDLFKDQLSGEEDNQPSCSVEEALKQQDLFVNDLVVACALNMLWQLLQGDLNYYAVQINLRTGYVIPLHPKQQKAPKRTTT